MINHFLFTIRQSIRSLLIYASALFVIQVALAAVFKQAGAGLPGGMGMLIDLLPDAVRGFVGSRELDLLTANGALAVSYNHPLTKVLLCIFAIGLPAGAIAGELERGTLDLLLARPIRRYELLSGSGLALVLGAGIMSASMLLGTVVGSYIGGISSEVAWDDFICLAINTFVLVLAIGGLGYMFSTLTRRIGQAVGWAAGLVACMFFLEWFSTMWSKIDLFTPLSIFHYYQPSHILNGNPNWWLNIIVLLGLNVLTFTAAIFIFERRDLTR